MECLTAEKYRAGQWVTLPVIVGHRQVNYTECPGDAFYALLPAIRANVASRMGSAVDVTVSASAPVEP